MKTFNISQGTFRQSFLKDEMFWPGLVSDFVLDDLEF